MAAAGKPLGLAIAGLGMAGAVMVRAAAAHPGVKLVAAAEPHAGPRAAFARDFKAPSYADIRRVVRRSCGRDCLYRDAASVPCAARTDAGSGRQAHHSRKADGAYACRMRRHHCGSRARQCPSDRWPHPCLRSGGPRDAAHRGERRTRPARHDRHLELHQFPLSPAAARRTRYGARRRHPVQSVAAPDRHRCAYRGRTPAQRSRPGNALDPSRPTEGSAVAFLEFENGAAASLVYGGYDFFDSDELHFWISERGAEKPPDQHGAAPPGACRPAGRRSAIARRTLCLWGARRAGRRRTSRISG